MVFPPVGGVGVFWGPAILPKLMLSHSGLVQGGAVRHMVPDKQLGGGVAGGGGVQGRAGGRGVQGGRGYDCPREGAAPECLGKLILGSLVRAWQGGKFDISVC